MADENLINISSVEDSPDLQLQNPIIEIGYLTSFTIVEGMPDELRRNFLCKGNVSTNNQTNQTGIYIDTGFLFVPAQSDLPYNQL